MAHLLTLGVANFIKWDVDYEIIDIMEEKIMSEKDYEENLEQRAQKLKYWEVESLLRFKDGVDETISDYYDDRQKDTYHNDNEAFARVMQEQNAHDFCGGGHFKYINEAMKDAEG